MTCETVLPIAAWPSPTSHRGVLLILMLLLPRCSPPFTSKTANFLVLLTTVDPFEGMMMVSSLQQPVCAARLVLLHRALAPKVRVVEK